MYAAYDGGPQTRMGGGAAASTPATGGGTYYAPPVESIQGAENYASAQDAYNKALIRFNQQRGGLLKQYGYLGDVDPSTGLVKNVRVDTGNSFGALQQLLHGQAVEDQGAQYAAEDRGLVGGLAHQGESELHYQHQAQSGNLANSLFNSLAGIDNQQYDAKSALDDALWQLQHQATTDAIDNGDYNPAGTDDGGGGDGSGGGGGGDGVNPRAAAVAKIVGSPAQIARASATAFKKAGGKSSPAAALAARSAGLNAAYGIGATKKAAPLPNPYTSGRKKRG